MLQSSSSSAAKAPGCLCSFRHTAEPHPRCAPAQPLTRLLRRRQNLQRRASNTDGRLAASDRCGLADARHTALSTHLQLVSGMRRSKPAAEGSATCEIGSQPAAAADSSAAQMLRRRAVLAGLAAAPLLTASWPQAARAGEIARDGLLTPPLPSLLDFFTGGPSQLPPPVRFPRRQLSQRFAVLLMQSCYKAADALDFCPMEDFQVRFWKRRQAAYGDYVQLHSGLQIRQGDLGDPLYFDFIAFSQFAAISEAMESGRQEFEEYCEDCNTTYRSVRRDPALADNRLLPRAFQAAAGDRVYNALRNGFPTADQQVEQFGGPPPAATGASLADLAAGARAIVDIFVSRGYATKGAVTDVRPNGAGGAGGSFTVRLDAPANLWGTAALVARRASIANAYDAMAVGGYLRASGVEGASYSFSRGDAATETRWTLP